MSDEQLAAAHKVTWLGPDRPVEGGTVYVKPESTPEVWWSPSRRWIVAEHERGRDDGYAVVQVRRGGEAVTEDLDEPPSDAVRLVDVAASLTSDERYRLQRRIEQIVGWAKAGRRGSDYLMDAENVDRLRFDLLDAVDEVLAVRAAQGVKP